MKTLRCPTFVTGWARSHFIYLGFGQLSSVVRESGQARSLLFRHFIISRDRAQAFSRGSSQSVIRTLNVRDSSAIGTPTAITVGSEGARMLVRAGRRVSRESGGVIRPWLAPWFSASDSVRSGGGARVDAAGAARIRAAPGRRDGFLGGPTTGTIAGPILATSAPRSFWRSALEALERAIEPSARARRRWDASHRLRRCPT